MNKEKLEEFINNVMCKRESNQHKAHLLWVDIRNGLSEEIVSKFEIEWSHYMLGEFESSEFARLDITMIKDNYNGKD